MKFHLTLLFIAFYSFSSFGNVNTSNVAKKDDGIIHSVQKGETLYMISRKYNVVVVALMEVNPGIPDSYVIQVGQNIVIPNASTNNAIKNRKADCVIVTCRYHVVQPGETLYSIATKYDFLTLENLKGLNDMKSNEIKEGQELVIKILDKEELAVEQLNEKRELWAQNKTTTTTTQTPMFTSTDKKVTERIILSKHSDNTENLKNYSQIVDIVEQYKRIFESYEGKQLAQKNEKCTASFLDESMGSSAFYALYNNVPIGTILKVKNLINHNIVYLKVVGRVPLADRDKNINIKISKPAATKLLTRDSKFVVEVISYM